MSSEQLEILCDGLMVYEVDPICEKLVAKGVRFKVVRVTDEEAGIVNSRKDNWASGLTQVCNYFNHGGLTEHLRILVPAEDLEFAKRVIAPEERCLPREPRPNLKLLILAVLAGLFVAIAWLATTCWSGSESRSVVAERQEEGPQRIAVLSCGLDRDVAAKICDLCGKPEPRTLVFCTADEDVTNDIARTEQWFRSFGVRAETVNICSEAPADLAALRRKIMTADIIWFGGGRTECLLHKLQDYYLFAPLWAAYWNGTVMAGSGTGAIVLSFAGYNDFKDEGRRDLIDGIGMVDAYFCPHCQDDAWRGFDERLGEELVYIGRAEVPETAWAQEDGTMVIFRNEEEEPEVKVLRPGSRVYRYKRTGGSWVKEEFR